MRVLLFLLALCSSLAAAAAPTKVVVVTDSWAQLMYLDEHNVPSGELADFVRRMNAVQDKFAFELNIFPRLRVDQAFADKQADVYPLRTVAWTKPSSGLLPTRTIFSSGDIYFARKDNRHGGRKVFEQMATRRVAGVRGYHYQLFKNNADEAYIRKHFRATLLGSNEAVISFVLAGRADVGIVPEVILAKFMQDPAIRAQLLIGEQYDSRVELSNLVRKDGPISVAEMNAIIELMVKSGDVARLKTRLSLPHFQTPKK
jgi:ABC-type amino acid transport substrate-binding protein